MKRITIVSLFSLVAALAAMGCSAPTGSDSEDVDRVQDRSHMVGLDGDGNAKTDLPPAQALELNLHLNDDSHGPHPEPWLDRIGPHPEPWQGKKASAAPTDPDAPDDSSKR